MGYVIFGLGTRDSNTRACKKNIYSFAFTIRLEVEGCCVCLCLFVFVVFVVLFRSVIFASTPVVFSPSEQRLLSLSSSSPLEYLLGDAGDARDLCSAIGKMAGVVGAGGQTERVAARGVEMGGEGEYTLRVL